MNGHQVHVNSVKLDELRSLERPGQEGFFARIITAFLTDAPRRMDEIDRGLETADPDAVAMAAHTLKGGCFYVGAAHLADLCLRLEEFATADAVESGRELAAEIRREVALVVDLLTAEIEKPS